MLLAIEKKQFIRSMMVNMMVNYIQLKLLHTLFEFLASKNNDIITHAAIYVDNIKERFIPVLEVCKKENFEITEDPCLLLSNIELTLTNALDTIKNLNKNLIKNLDGESADSFPLYARFKTCLDVILTELSQCFLIEDKLPSMSNSPFLNEEKLNELLNSSAIDVIALNLYMTCLKTYQETKKAFAVERDKNKKSSTSVVKKDKIKKTSAFSLEGEKIKFPSLLAVEENKNNKPNTSADKNLKQEEIMSSDKIIDEAEKIVQDLYKKISTRLSDSTLDNINALRDQNFLIGFNKFERIWGNIDLFIRKISNVYLLDYIYSIAHQYIITHVVHGDERKLDKILAQDLMNIITALRLKYGKQNIRQIAKLTTLESFQEHTLMNFCMNQQAIAILSAYLNDVDAMPNYPSSGEEIYGEEYKKTGFVKQANQECIKIVRKLITKYNPAFSEQLKEIISLPFFDSAPEVSLSTQTNDVDMLAWYLEVCSITSEQLEKNPQEKDLFILKKLATALVIVGFTVRSKEKSIIKEAMINVLQKVQGKYYVPGIKSKILGQPKTTQQITLALAQITQAEVGKNDSPTKISASINSFVTGLADKASPLPKSNPPTSTSGGSMANILNQLNSGDPQLNDTLLNSPPRPPKAKKKLDLQDDSLLDGFTIASTSEDEMGLSPIKTPHKVDTSLISPTRPAHVDESVDQNNLTNSF